MTLRILSLAWLLLAMPIIVLGAHQAAADAFDAEVLAGSVGNRAEFTLINPSRTLAAENPKLMVVTRPSWMQVTGIEAEQDPLPAGASRSFVLVFDVADDADPGDDGVLEVVFQAEAALFDQSPIRVRFGVSAPEDEEKCTIDHEHAIPGWTGEEKHFVYIFRHHQSAEILRVLVYSGPADGSFPIALQGRHDEKLGPFSELGHAMHKAEQYCDSSTEPLGEPGAPPRLRLVRIDHRGKTGGTSQLGASVQQSRSLSQAQYDEILSVDLQAPSEIVAGETILISGSAMRSVQYEEGSFCYPGEPEPDSQSSRITLKVGSEEVTVRGAEGLANYCLGNVKDEWHTNTASSWYSYTNSFTGHSSATLTLSPAGVERRERRNRPDEVLYRYRVEATGRAELLEEPDTAEIVLIRQTYRTDAQGFVITDDPSMIDELPKLQVKASTPSGSDQAWGAYVYLVYAPVAADSHTIAPTPYEHPESFPQIPRRAADDPAVEAEGTDSSGIEASDERDSSGTGTGGRPGGERQGSIDPSRLDPTSRNISPLIREWINTAEPPENITQAAQLHYDQWGRKVGKTGDGSIVTASGKPDYAQSTPEETVWSMRKKLDSVNRCTLEEFVVAKLQNRSLESCRGRYQAPGLVTVPNLSGLPLAEAQKRLEDIGLTPRLVAGKPAPSRDKEGIIADQEPGSGTKLQPGGRVKLVVYGPYSPGIKVSNVAGLSVEDAKKALAAKGLKVRLSASGPAPTADLSLKVKESEPKGGMRVTPGTEVALKVYGPYSPPVSVDLAGAYICTVKCPAGGVGAVARIEQNGAALVFFNEAGDRSRGRFLDTSTVVAEEWGNLRAAVQAGGQELHWENGTVWQHKSGSESPPKKVLGLVFPPYGGSISGYRQGDKIVLGAPGQWSGYLVWKGDRYERYDKSGKLISILKKTWAKPWDFGNFAIGGQVRAVREGNIHSGWYAVIVDDDYLQNRLKIQRDRQ